jgi:hypothetical protein
MQKATDFPSVDHHRHDALTTYRAAAIPLILRSGRRSGALLARLASAAFQGLSESAKHRHASTRDAPASIRLTMVADIAFPRAEAAARQIIAGCASHYKRSLDDLISRRDFLKARTSARSRSARSSRTLQRGNPHRASGRAWSRTFRVATERSSWATESSRRSSRRITESTHGSGAPR